MAAFTLKADLDWIYKQARQRDCNQTRFGLDLSPPNQGGPTKKELDQVWLAKFECNQIDFGLEIDWFLWWCRHWRYVLLKLLNPHIAFLPKVQRLGQSGVNAICKFDTSLVSVQTQYTSAANMGMPYESKIIKTQNSVTGFCHGFGKCFLRWLPTSINSLIIINC